MFHSARLKLTAWYLAIIMVISLSFSAIIYQGVTFEIQRRLNTIERRLRLGQYGLSPPAGQIHFFAHDLQTAKNKVFLMLLYTNGAIFILSGVAGYFLAGKTLQPIEKAMGKQKQFIADASHELKTPLTALKTSIEVALRNKKLKMNEAKEVLKDSLKDIDYLNNLTSNLLNLTSYLQKANFAKDKVNLESTVKKVYKKILPLTKKKKIKFDIRTKKINLQANKESLEKLLTILIDNAVKYTKKDGEITLITDTKGGKAVIKIADTGIGITQKDLPYIFDRFFRAERSRTKIKASGVGLGLSMAKEIVKLHKGKIDVKSKPEKGTTFTVKLPLS